MRDYHQLQIWQRSHQLVLRLYELTKNFPKGELFGLTSQIRRACVSIPTNIAEGCGKDSITELARYIQIAMGSASELEYELELACSLEYISEQDYKPLADELTEIRKMLTGFSKGIKRLQAKG